MPLSRRNLLASIPAAATAISPVAAIADYETSDARAPVTLSLSSCYEVDVETDTMSPRLERYMTLHVHPHHPPRINQAHIFYSVNGDQRALAELVRWDDATWYVRHYQPDPDKVMKLRRAEWPTAHLVIGWSGR